MEVLNINADDQLIRVQGAGGISLFEEGWTSNSSVSRTSKVKDFQHDGEDKDFFYANH